MRLEKIETSALTASEDLDKMIVAEESLGRLMDDFKQASLYAVHCVVRKDPAPLNLFNLYGDDGEKYVVGGILIRRAKGWTICGTTGSDEPTAKVAVESSGEVSAKIAGLNVRNLALLRC